MSVGEPRIAAAVEDAAVADQDVVARRRLCERRGASASRMTTERMSRVRTASFLLKHGWDGEDATPTTVAGLRHVGDGDTPGIRRLGCAGPLPLRARRRPQGRTRPSWRGSSRWSFRRPGPTSGSVPIPRGHLQATGRDARGRKQYRYHPRFRQMRDEVKYSRLPAFAQALRRIRRRTAADVRKRGLPRVKVLAAAVQLLEKTLIRIGNEEYARANGSVGLTTMHDRHATIRGADGAVRVPRQERRRARRRAPRRAPRAHRQGLPRSARLRAVSVRRRDRATRQTICSDDVNAYLREISGDDVHRQGFPDLGRHGAGGAGAGAARAVQVADRSEAQRRAGDRVRRQAARQHQVGLPQVPTSIRRSSRPTWTASRWRPTSRASRR